MPDASNRSTPPKKGPAKQGRRHKTHFLTPVEALLAIQRLWTETDGAERRHVAYCLGMSDGNLSKNIMHLSSCALGDEEACATYNSRTQFMRLLYTLDLAPRSVRESLMRDALLNGNENNSAATRGRLSKSSDDSVDVIGIEKEDIIRILREIPHLLAEGAVLTGDGKKARFRLKKERNA